MAIPNFRDDLSVISKLPDLPRATNGYPADVFKAEFDKAGLAIQKFINEKLVPAIVAGQIPFNATTEIAANNIQAAIENVQAQVKDAATGSIVNGSVTKEKLSQELLDRVFGGRPWVGLDTPNAAHNPAAGFPVGQIWLRPGFTVSNQAGTEWTATACTVEAGTDTFTMTGSKEAATARILQTLTGLGNEDDRVFVRFDVAERDSEITSLTVSVNGANAEETKSHNVLEAALLESGVLTVQLESTWPSTSLAGGSVTIQNYAVVNVSQILRQMSEAADMEDWSAYLSNLLPLATYVSPAEIYMQVSDGQWWAIGYEVQPVSRGGTGITSADEGALLIGTGENRFSTVLPGEDESILQMQGGAPGWVPAEQLIVGKNVLRSTTGSYTGNNTSGRTVTLPVAAKLVILFTADGSENPVVLCSGGCVSGEFSVWHVNQNQKVAYKAYAWLEGDTLRFTCDSKTDTMGSAPTTQVGNVSGVTYNWLAIY